MRNAIVSSVLRLFVLAAMSCGIPGFLCGMAQAAPLPDDWRTDFESLCAQTQNAASLSDQELQSLVQRCDALTLRLEKLKDPERRIMLKRLGMCRSLYAFMLDSREGAPR